MITAILITNACSVIRRNRIGILLTGFGAVTFARIAKGIITIFAPAARISILIGTMFNIQIATSYVAMIAIAGHTIIRAGIRILSAFFTIGNRRITACFTTVMVKPRIAQTLLRGFVPVGICRTFRYRFRIRIRIRVGIWVGIRVWVWVGIRIRIGIRIRFIAAATSIRIAAENISRSYRTGSQRRRSQQIWFIWCIFFYSGLFCRYTEKTTIRAVRYFFQTGRCCIGAIRSQDVIRFFILPDNRKADSIKSSFIYAFHGISALQQRFNFFNIILPCQFIKSAGNTYGAACRIRLYTYATKQKRQ